MSNSQITSQLTRVTAPSIGDSNFAEGIRNAFETINNNFKNIASLPFIQGVQGDSYTLISKDIWVEVNDNVSPVYYALTKEGAVLLNSIFESFFRDNTDDTKKFHEGDSFDKCKTNILGELSLNGISPIDSFFTVENGSVKPVNNKLYFYSIINNLNEEQDTYLGQYFYFIDYRITELGNAYQSENLSDFIDFTGFYQYQPASENEPEKYNSISIVPSLYYDKDKDDICWKYNGQETGISAIGPKGLDGKDANFEIVYVKNENGTNNSGDILGYFDPEKETIEYTNTLKNCFCLVQFVNTETNEDDTVKIASYVDSAFGEVHENKVYWQNSLKIGKLFNNQNITRYFCSMGNNSDGIENNPYYFAIPVYLERNEANTNNYKEGHVFSSSSDGKLVLQKANNAFTEAGGQVPLAELDTQDTQGEFNIANYNVSINKYLGVNGDLGVTGNAIFRKDLTVVGTLGVEDEATFRRDLDIEGNIIVRGGGIFNDNLSVGGTLGVNGTLGVTGKATLDSDLTVGGTLDAGNATIGTLGVTGKATLDSDLDVNGALWCGGSFSVENQSSSFGGDIHMEDGGELTAYLDNADISEKLNVGKRLVVNSAGTNDVSYPSEIYGRYANLFTGGTSDGGTGLIVYGGPGRETGFTAQGNGGVGLVVKGGTAGNYTGSTYSKAGYGGTGLVVYGGEGSVSGHGGAAIDAYGIIKARDGITIYNSSNGYTAGLSVDSNGLNVSKNIAIDTITTANGIIKLHRCGGWGELSRYWDISGDETGITDVEISYSTVVSDVITDGLCGKGLLSLYATGDRGTEESYSVTIKDCPNNSIICFGVRMNNPRVSGNDLDNVKLYVKSKGSDIKQYIGEMGTIKSDTTVYKSFIVYVV